jgi:predicted CoA-binding protein
MAQAEKVVVLGASDKPERYAYKAVADLLAHGHTVIPVHPRITKVQGLMVYSSLATVPGPVDTLTLYVNPQTGLATAQAMIQLQPRRVIMNPGTESDELAHQLSQAGIVVQRACTLVLLSTGQY